MKIKQIITRRLQRLVGGNADPTAKEISDGILNILERSSSNIGSFLDIARSQGSLALDNIQSDRWHGGLPNVYQLGNYDLGYVVLPGARMLDRSFDTETLVIDVSVGEDIFYLTLWLDEQGNVQCGKGWKRNPDRPEWPESVSALQSLQTKIIEVISLLAELLALQSGT